MTEFDREKVFEVVQKNSTPPGHFYSTLSRKDGWLGAFSYNFEDYRWNQLIPVPGNDHCKVPVELVDLASDMGDKVSIYGEKGFVDEVVDDLGLEDVDIAFEMTYLVPEDLPEGSSLPDLKFRQTDDEEVREDFMDIFRKSFGKEMENGSYFIGDDMRVGVRKIIEEKTIGVERVSYVGYQDGVSVAIGTLTVKDGEGFMFNVASHPDHRGEGFGTAVSVKLEQEAENIGLEQVFIGTQPNTDVENFYKGIGCREVFKTKCVEVEFDDLREVQGE